MKENSEVKSDVLPCPFCGSEPETNLAYGSSQITCSNDECGVFMVMLNEVYLDGIIERWNKRATHDRA